MPSAAATEKRLGARANMNPASHSKYITFKLERNEYGIDLFKVRELIGGQELTRVPSASPFVRGLLALRGRIIVVLDLRVKFGMPPAPTSSQSVVLVTQLAVQSSNLTTGILVDEVLEVRTLPDCDVTPTPSSHASVDASFLIGVAKTDQRVISLLDVARILDGEQQREVLHVSQGLSLCQVRAT